MFGKINLDIQEITLYAYIFADCFLLFVPRHKIADRISAVVNLSKILWTTFVPTKNYKAKLIVRRKKLRKTLSHKKLHAKYWWKWQIEIAVVKFTKVFGKTAIEATFTVSSHYSHVSKSFWLMPVLLPDSHREEENSVSLGKNYRMRLNLIKEGFLL